MEAQADFRDGRNVRAPGACIPESRDADGRDADHGARADDEKQRRRASGAKALRRRRGAQAHAEAGAGAARA